MGRISGNCLGSLLRRGTVPLLGLLMVPGLASAESIDLVRIAEIPAPLARRADSRPLLGLDKNGDVTIQYRNLSLTMSYSPTDLLPPARERVVLNTSPVSTAIGGFGIKVDFAF